MRVSVSALTAAVIFSLSVDARWHYSCTCHTGPSYNWRLTTAACNAINPSVVATGNGHVAYNTPSGRCTSDGGNLLDGDDMEWQCKQAAINGFECAFDSKQTCFADQDTVSSWCD
ncbi:hypothetical protein CTRI78_v010047 [Colletotrichum trifolii]|uniref:Secreted protein n=1 Tax=Colletotrichum trifolii TaxID=5466 RepID=A0A4R8QWN3_COLTR|nr:hypothetical protein CTRI78_v010047 [Colletotrichum trifolii]